MTGVLFRQTMKILDFSMRSQKIKSSDGCLLFNIFDFDIEDSKGKDSYVAGWFQPTLN
jgi:hypothetical protein